MLVPKVENRGIAEAIAIREACILYLKARIKEAVIESDNSSVVSWCIAEDGAPPWEVKVIIDDIRTLAIKASLSVSVIRRSANEVANWIARIALSLGSWSFNMGCIPHKLALLVSKDV
ncbi:hypothetical protein LguiA_006195 [Lonicera macranthoides]